MQRKRRMPIQREPMGKTKAQVLLFVANNQRCTTSHIRSYLKNSLNIRNTKGVRKHISELVEQKYLAKSAKGKGFEDLYYIDTNNSSFTNCFNFLQNQEMAIDFLKTKYAKEIISDKDFFINGLLNVSRKLFSDSYHFFLNDEKVKEVVRDVFRSTEGRQAIENLLLEKNHILDKIPKGFVSSIESLTLENLDEYIKDLEQFLKVPIKGPIYNFLNEFLLQGQVEDVANIISASPSAMNYFLNFRTEGVFLLTSELVFAVEPMINQPNAFRKEFFKQMKEKFGRIEEELNELENEMNGMEQVPDSKDVNLNSQGLTTTVEEVIELYRSIIQKHTVGQNPLVSALKSYFTIDAINGKLVLNDFSKRLLSDILLPHTK